MEILTQGIIVVVAFAIAFSIARMIVRRRAAQAARRVQAGAERQRLDESLKGPAKNKSKRRREQLLQRKGRKA